MSLNGCLTNDIWWIWEQIVFSKKKINNPPFSNHLYTHTERKLILANCSSQNCISTVIASLVMIEANILKIQNQIETINSCIQKDKITQGITALYDENKRQNLNIFLI